MLTSSNENRERRHGSPVPPVLRRSPEIVEHDNLTESEARARGYDPVAVERYRRKDVARAEALAFIPEVEAAFEGVPRPRITLSVATALDDHWEFTEESMAEFSARDPEQRWQDVPLEAVEVTQEYFTFSDDAGWRFYLPAFMTHCLRDLPNWHWCEPLAACSRKTHVGLLSQDQLLCVERFVELCKRHGHHP